MTEEERSRIYKQLIGILFASIFANQGIQYFLPIRHDPATGTELKALEVQCQSNERRSLDNEATLQAFQALKVTIEANQRRSLANEENLHNLDVSEISRDVVAIKERQKADSEIMRDRLELLLAMIQDIETEMKEEHVKERH